MKNWLILHPADRSSDFLRGLYKDLPNKTVLNGGITKVELRKLIATHRCIFCGHGSPNGLFSVGQLPDAYPYIIDDSMVDLLRYKIIKKLSGKPAKEAVKVEKLPNPAKKKKPTQKQRIQEMAASANLIKPEVK